MYTKIRDVALKCRQCWRIFGLKSCDGKIRDISKRDGNVETS
jgi:hypothetical protein